MNGWYWLGLAALLGLTELAVPGVYLAFLAVAAALTGVLALAVPDAPLWTELGCFALGSIAAVAVGRRWYHERPVPTDDPLLNDRLERLIGTVVTVEQALVDGHGRVRVGDGAWPATGPDLAAGTRARIVGYEGGVLAIDDVTPADSVPPPASVGP